MSLRAPLLGWVTALLSGRRPGARLTGARLRGIRRGAACVAGRPSSTQHGLGATDLGGSGRGGLEAQYGLAKALNAGTAAAGTDRIVLGGVAGAPLWRAFGRLAKPYWAGSPRSQRHVSSPTRVTPQAHVSPQIFVSPQHYA